MYLQVLGSFILQRAKVGVEQQHFTKSFAQQKSAHQSGQIKQKPACAVVQRAIAEGHHVSACGDGDQQQVLLEAPAERPQGQAPLTQKVCPYAGWPLFPRCTCVLTNEPFWHMSCREACRHTLFAEALSWGMMAGVQGHTYQHRSAELSSTSTACWQSRPASTPACCKA